MMRISAYVLAGVCLVAVSACSKKSSAPASPSPSSAAKASAAPDGSTLKVSAPVPVSPKDGQQPSTLDVTLTLLNVIGQFAPVEGGTYHYQLFDGANTLIYEIGNIAAGASETSHTLPSILEGDQPYSWRARYVTADGFGPWSDQVAFIAPTTKGYMRGNELYDPLINGETLGERFGATSFIPGRGIRLEAQTSYVRYVLPQTLTEGEFSILVTDMPTNTEGDKTKLFAMAEGFDDIVTNNRRMTIEKRGDPPGVIAWRFITHDDQIETLGAERVDRTFHSNLTYFWQATWRSNFFRLVIKEGGADGRTIYNFGKPFNGRPYDPSPHVIYLGSPVGRSGPNGASVDHVTIRQVWVSGRPRPAFANQ